MAVAAVSNGTVASRVLIVSTLKIAISGLVFEMGNSGFEIFEQIERLYRTQLKFHVAARFLVKFANKGYGEQFSRLCAI
jgi:hypothetical protein